MSSDRIYIGKTAYRGEVAANYDRDRVTEPIWKEEQRWMEAWARCVPRGARLLDLPAGTGRFIEIWRARGARVHAVDISADMLAALRRRWPDGDANLIIERADGEALPFASGSFDFVVCWRLFHLLPAEVAERVLRELARVCRGQIVLEVFNVSQEGRLRLLARAAKVKIRQWLGATSPRTVSSETPWAHITSYPQTEHGMRALFGRCGVRLNRAETLTHYQGTPTRVYHLEAGGRA